MFRLLRLKKEIHIEGLYTFFYFEHGRDFRYVGERHDFWEMVYVDHGEISAVSDNTAYTLPQGNVIFHRPMEFHGMTAVNNKPHNVLVVTFETKSPAMEQFAKKIFTVQTHAKKILSRMLNEMTIALGPQYNRTENDEPLVLQDEKARAYQIGILQLENFLLELLRDNQSVDRAEKQSQLAKKNVENAMADAIKDYLAAHIYTSISLGDVCRHFHMSRSYICQLFKNETGRGVIDYYIYLKIKEAKLLIREGQLNFTQIAEKLGYTSLQHFTRSFQSRENMSPSRYEKSIK